MVYWLVVTQLIDSVDVEHTIYVRSSGVREDGSTWKGA